MCRFRFSAFGQIYYFGIGIKTYESHMNLYCSIVFKCYVIAVFIGTVDVALAKSLLIENVSVYDVSSGDVRPDQSILVIDNTISQVGMKSSIDVPEGATLISGDGLTALPGLTDSHVHMNEIDAGTFLANGVTSVRELNGSPQLLQLRDAIARGEVRGPRMLVSSPLISGKDIQFRHILLTSPLQADKLPMEMQLAGYDYLKIYDDLSLNVYQRLADSANDVGIELAGHIPEKVGLLKVLSAGQHIEHNEKIVAAILLPDYSNLEPLDEAADRILEAGIAVTPTLAVHEFLSNRQSNEVRNRLVSSELAYVDSGIVEWWKSMFRALGQTNRAMQGAQNFLNAQRYLLARMEERGVPIMVGTDTPNPLMVAGFSLHDELDALVRAGLSNEAAIRAATQTPGAQMPWSNRVGEIKSGFAADIVFVRGNPARDIKVLREPAGVIANGEWLDRKSLDEILQLARRN